MNRTSLGVLFAFLAPLGLGIAVALARTAYSGGADGPTLAAVRALIMCGGLALFAHVTGRRLYLAPRDSLHAIGLGILAAVMFYGNIGAVEYISVGLAALLFYTFPPLIALIHWIVLKQQIGVVRSLAIGLSLAGMWVMLDVSFADAHPLGMAMALAASVATAWNGVWLAQRCAHLDIVAVMMTMTATSAVILVVLAWASGGPAWPGTALGWYGFISAVTLQALAVPFYFVAIRLIGALRCAVVGNIQPLASLAAAYILYGEVLQITVLTGGAMILIGIVVLQVWPVKNRPSR